LHNLYSNILEPLLTAKQSSALLETLRRAPSSSSTLHRPASLIRKLSVKDDGSKLGPAKFKAQTQSTVQALDNLRLLPLSDQRGSSLLRVLGRILRSHGAFPHLRELIVTSNGMNNNFNIL
jgi:hypothetical protein